MLYLIRAASVKVETQDEEIKTGRWVSLEDFRRIMDAEEVETWSRIAFEVLSPGV